MGTVILGAGGRLGQLLRPIYPGPALWLTRSNLDVIAAAPETLQGALDGADAVICLAGVTHGSGRPMAENTLIATRVLDAARAVNAGPVILFSTAAIYGALPGPLREDGPTAPASPYAIAKLEMEADVLRHAHPHLVLRLGNVAGADAILGNWAPGFHLDTLPDGSTPRRSYVGPNSLARILHELTQRSGHPPLLNVAAPGTVEMGALLDAAGLPWSARRATQSTIASVHLDTQVLETLTSFDPRDSTPEGIVADWQLAKGAQ